MTISDEHTEMFSRLCDLVEGRLNFTPEEEDPLGAAIHATLVFGVALGQRYADRVEEFVRPENPEAADELNRIVHFIATGEKS